MRITSIKVCIILIFLFMTSFSLSDEVVQQETGPKYERAGKRNPFIPIITTDGQLINIQDEDENSELNLEGIIYDKSSQSMAIINGQILKANETIGGVKIVEIRKDSVVYVKDGEIFILNQERKE